MNFVKTLLAVLLANIVLCALLFAVLIAGGLAMKLTDKGKIEDGSYLVVDIYGDVMEYNPPETIVSHLVDDDTETLHRILDNLDKAAHDDRVEGVILKLSSNNSLGYAMIEEIRGAVARVQDAGKPVYAYGDYLDRKTLFLASACDSIFMPDAGELQLTGMAFVGEFIKGALDKLGVRANIHRIKDYKAAAEMVLREDMSPESKENMNWMLDDLWGAQLSAIADDRGLTRDAVDAAMEYALYQPTEALDAGFIDGVAYWTDLEERWKRDGDDELRVVTQSEYAKVTRESLGLGGADAIAVVHAHGMIGGRESRVDPALGVLMGHETVVANLRAAAKDKRVKAVVFRVDSNGGESLASDIIGHEVERIARTKPVIVSMVDVAASGGYTISYRATKVVADSMTITGSIGSISGKFNTAGMWNKIGVTFDWVTKGPNAMLYAAQTDFTEEQRLRFEDNHWTSFNAWVADVARKRGMAFEEVLVLAEGRVWTGRQARENGLIDETGGLDRAIEIAREEAGIGAEDDVAIDHFPKEKGLIALLSRGNAPNSAVAWVLYRYIRHDLAETLRLVAERRLEAWEYESVR
jgi:protease-4